MSRLSSSKALLLSAVAGAGVLGGALFFGAGIVSAADPTPTPAPSQQQAAPNGGQPAAPGQGGTHDPANCPNMGNDNGGTAAPSSGTQGGGVSFRGGPRGYHY
ncbi:MAG TPA: hypothetical protein VH951_00115 [Dehalococcoidia bacterium]